MQLRAVSLLVLAIATPSVAAQTALEDSVFESTPPGSAVERLGPLLEGLTDLGRNPDWVGVLYDPDRDPQIERPTWYVIRPDSTLWVRSPSGASIILDAQAAVNLGVTAEETLEFGREVSEGLGWGVQDGRVFLYASKGTDISRAVAIGLAVVLLVVATVVGLVRALRRSRRRERLVSESRRRLADARENERLRIAREIHDGPVQDLHAVRLLLGAVTAAESPPLEPISSDVLSVIAGLRSISEDLRPPALSSMGLVAAVQSFIGRFERVHPTILIDLEVVGHDGDIPLDVGLVVFRVVQEAVNNAANHAHPQSVFVRIEKSDARVLAAVEDDGVGFEPPAHLESLGTDGHYGILGMSERAESVGGELRIESRSPRGTRVLVTVPVTW